MKKDITENSLIDENHIFADIANVNIFGGKELILPKDLSSVPTTGYYRETDGKWHRLIRDVIKEAANLHGCIAFLGFENQNAISNIMPVRCMGYTYTSYIRQINDYMAENRKNNRPAFSREIHDEQKLKPVMTYVLYFGKDKWEKPLSLMDMLDIHEEDKEFWGSFIEDYHIQVIHMVNQPKEIRDKYKSDFKLIADYLACGNDKDKIRQTVLENRQKLIHAPQVLDLLEALSNDKRYEEMKNLYLIYTEKEEEETSMCVLMDLFDEKYEQGIEQGMNLSADVFKTIQNGIRDNDVISQVCNCTVDEVKAVRTAFGI